MVLNLTNKPQEWEKIQTTNKMVKSNQKLEFVFNKLNQFVDLYCENTNDVQVLNIELCKMLEFENEPLIHKLGITELNGVKVSFNSLDEWNNQFIEFDDIIFDVTSMEEIEELYQAICKFEEKQNSNFENSIKDYPTEFQATIKDSLKYGRTIYSDEKYILKDGEQPQKLQSIVDYLNNEKLRFSKLRKSKVETGSPEPELSQYGLGAESVVNELLQILNK